MSNSEKDDGILLLDPDGCECLYCGRHALDTGWECTECGKDNMPWYYPEGYRQLCKVDINEEAGFIFDGIQHSAQCMCRLCAIARKARTENHPASDNNAS